MIWLIFRTGHNDYTLVERIIIRQLSDFDYDDPAAAMNDIVIGCLDSDVCKHIRSLYPNVKELINVL